MTAEAFPDEEAAMVSTKRQLPAALHQANVLRAKHRKVVKQLAQHNRRMRAMESESEFQLMTNPDLEKADAEAQDKLKSLRGAERHLAGQLRDARRHSAKLAKQVLEEEKLHAVSEKAVLLMNRFKSNYIHKLDSERAQFKARALKAAAKKAKAMYRGFEKRGEAKLQADKKSRLHRQQLRRLARTKRQTARKIARAARKRERERQRGLRKKARALALARRLAEEDARSKAQAEAMFKEYKTRFREMEQERSEAQTEETADLGESGPDMPSLPQRTESSDEMATLDKLEASMAAPPKKRRVVSPKVAATPKARKLDPDAAVAAARAAVAELAGYY